MNKFKGSAKLEKNTVAKRAEFRKLYNSLSSDEKKEVYDKFEPDCEKCK